MAAYRAEVGLGRARRDALASAADRTGVEDLIRIAAAVSHLHHDEAELRQRDVLQVGGVLAERLGHALGLRSGIDEGDDRILPARIEVERLEHHAVQIGDAVGRFHRERFGKLEAGRERRAQVGGLELGDRRPAGVDERRLRRAVNARRRVDEIFPAIVAADRVGRVAGIEQLDRTSVEAHAIEVRVVRVFAGFAPVRREQQRARLLVDADDAVDHELICRLSVPLPSYR